jgi:hypothetical protein
MSPLSRIQETPKMGCLVNEYSTLELEKVFKNFQEFQELKKRKTIE